MDESKLFCRRCKQFGDFTAAGKFLICPNCGQQFEPSELSHAFEAKGGCLQTIFWFLLILVVIFLVGLAFIYAACSHGF